MTPSAAATRRFGAPPRRQVAAGRRILVQAGAALLLAACGALPRPKPASPTASQAQGPRTLDLALDAGRDLNPDASGRPSPIMLRLYQLRSANTFTTADFFALFDKDVATLGAELLVREELTLLPGASLAVRRALVPDATTLGVLAAFRDFDQSTWRATLALAGTDAVPVHLVVDARRVQLAGGR